MPEYGHTEPRIFTPPLRPLTPETSAGFSVIEFAEKVLEFHLLPWQKWLLIHALELLPLDIEDHPLRPRFRFHTILVLVGRQNGKSTLTMILILWFMMVRCVELIIGTAQSLGISEALWQEAVDMVQATPVLSECIHRVHMANGGKRLRMDVGDGLISEYKVEAASRKGARGRTADLVVLDELREHQTFDAWAAASNTTLAKSEGLIWCITNAGDSSSVVLEHLRDVAHHMLGDPDHRFDEDEWDEAIDGDEASSSLGFFEWSAPPDADPSAMETWAYANPSAGYTIGWDKLRDAYINNPPAEFLTECLCQWVRNLGEKPFPGDAWANCLDENSYIDASAPLVFGVDVAPDRKHCAISACGQRPDGDYHIELVAYATKMSLIESWFRRRVDSYGGQMTVCLQGKGCPASALISSLSAIPGVDVVPCQGPALTASCGAFYDAIAIADPDSQVDSQDDIHIYHLAQPGLDVAAEVAQKRQLGDAWAWDRKHSREDISPLCAATWAFGYAAGIYDGEPVGAGKQKKVTSMKAEGRTRAMLFV